MVLGIESEVDIELGAEKIKAVRTVEEALHLLKSANRD